MAFDAADDVMDSAVAILPSAPLVNIAPKVTIVEPADGTTIPLTQLEPQMHFVANVSDYEDGAGCCGVSWYLGKKLIGHGPTLDAMLPTATVCGGDEKLAAVAVDSKGKTTRAEVTLHFSTTNMVPIIVSPGSGQTFYRGVTYVFEATALDRRGASLPCTNIGWSSNDPTFVPTTGSQVPATFATSGDRSISISMQDPCGGSYQTMRTIHVVDPPPTDPPIVSITNPVGTLVAPYAVPTPTGRLSLTSSVSSPGGHPLTFAWSARDAGTSGAFKPVGATQNYVWVNPSAMFPFACGGRTIEIQLCATDSNGTTCKSTFARLIYPVC